MKTEIKHCQNCKTSFTIEPEDFAFYERISASRAGGSANPNGGNVPPPTWCWKCRLMRRLASRPSRAMYKAKCDLCGEDMVSLHHPGSKFIAYCNPCWNGDGWDALSYGKDYDFEKPFFVQFRELLERVPRRSTRMTNSPTCRYSDSVVNCKNCFMVIGGLNAEDCMYGSPVFSKNSVDTDVVINGDHAYETVSATNVFNTKFVYFSDDCIDSSFLFDCKGCTSCFGCMNLRNSKYCIFNKQFSKAEYEKQMEYWDLGSYSRIQEAYERFREILLSTPRRFAIHTNAIDSVGDDLKNVKNCKMCFIAVNGAENCKYGTGIGLLMKDSYDVTSGGDKSQLVYESSGILQCDQIKFVNGGNSLHDVEYCEQCFSSSYLFGCIGVKHKKYMILNKQYDKSTYEKLRSEIIQQMTDMPYINNEGIEYRYGEFFPVENSAYPYNGSWAYERYPMKKEDAVKKGYEWYEREHTVYNPDFRANQIQDNIKDIDNSIANKIIECGHKGVCDELCTTAYRIIPEELQFYKKMKIALPRLCPNCRYFQRLSMRNPYNLWHRKCMKPCCPNEFETACAPNRPDIIYCQTCYNQEFL